MQLTVDMRVPSAFKMFFSDGTTPRGELATTACNILSEVEKRV